MASEEGTIATAFAIIPVGSTEKTDLAAAFDTLLTKIEEAATATAFSNDVRDQLKSEAIDLAERIASCMIDHES